MCGVLDKKKKNPIAGYWRLSLAYAVSMSSAPSSSQSRIPRWPLQTISYKLLSACSRKSSEFDSSVVKQPTNGDQKMQWGNNLNIFQRRAEKRHCVYGSYRKYWSMWRPTLGLETLNIPRAPSPSPSGTGNLLWFLQCQKNRNLHALNNLTAPDPQRVHHDSA